MFVIKMVAVILDVALNHAFGRNPMVRMWMNDPDGDGWGSPTVESPYFNTVAKHSYNVGKTLIITGNAKLCEASNKTMD
jgi:hypothetical protein